VQIIVVSRRFPKAISINLSLPQVLLGAGSMVLLVLLLSGSLSYVALRHAADLKISFLKDVVAGVQEEESRKTQDMVRDNIKAIASKVGQLQAQLLHLDTLGERLSSVVGIKPAELRQAEARKSEGKGGPLVDVDQHRMSAEELGFEVDRLMRRVEFQSDYLSVVESSLMDARIAHNRLPTVLPVNALWSASAYGWRVDPFTQQRAMHEGVDFSARVGTPIVAAANGVVIAAEQHPEYGNLVEVDHGNDYTTRYAHASTLLVKTGQLVKRGQRLAEVGSTGRSTGPHLHFEVRYKGASVNPARFLPRLGDTSVSFAQR
jgi:murein DD-endopeptidase MepM/ murein hydrolase activator NlpD